jgi:hypothetical protein
MIVGTTKVHVLHSKQNAVKKLAEMKCAVVKQKFQVKYQRGEQNDVAPCTFCTIPQPPLPPSNIVNVNKNQEI